MNVSEFRSQYLINIVKQTYRYGWLVSAIAALIRFQNGVVSFEFLIIYLILATLATAGTFIP